MFLALTGSAKRLEDELARSFGPEEAHRITSSGEMFMGRHSYGGSASK